VPAGKTYDFTKAEDCINKVGEAYKDAKVTKDEIKTYTDACTLLFSGTGVKDSACSADGDCKLSDGLRCVLSTTTSGQTDAGALSVSGTCQVPKIVLGGDSCAAVDAMCTVGYHCGATKHCDVNGDTGEACSAALPCKQTLKCSDLGMCVAKLLDGSPCMIDDDCANGICLEQSNICVSQITFAPNEPFCISAR
jgi:hypothetical protein